MGVRVPVRAGARSSACRLPEGRGARVGPAPLPVANIAFGGGREPKQVFEKIEVGGPYFVRSGRYAQSRQIHLSPLTAGGGEAAPSDIPAGAAPYRRPPSTGLRRCSSSHGRARRTGSKASCAAIESISSIAFRFRSNATRAGRGQNAHR